MRGMILLLVALLALVILARRIGRIPARLARELLGQGALVVDVRTSAEFEAGHLPQAHSAPLDQLAERLPRIAPAKSQPLLFHCQSGVRSGAARRLARSLGYTQAFNLGAYSRAAQILAQGRD